MEIIGSQGETIEEPGEAGRFAGPGSFVSWEYGFALPQASRSKNLQQSTGLSAHITWLQL